jgi:glutamate 5-kinase
MQTSAPGSQDTPPFTPSLDQFRRVVLKVGSALLVDRANVRVRRE